ncbi:hypothetical protein Droror1_Dr00019981, partial [Drosera rotundifolia]
MGNTDGNVVGSKSSRSSLRASIKEYLQARSKASFANISFKTESSRHRYITEEIAKYGKGNITSQILTFKELAKVTNDFAIGNLVGEGGFGRVYKGYLESTKQ